MKRFLRLRSGRSPQQSRHRPHRPATWREPDPSFRLLPANGTAPAADEVRGNPRARSARLRAAERTAAPAWPREHAAEVAP